MGFINGWRTPRFYMNGDARGPSSTTDGIEIVPHKYHHYNYERMPVSEFLKHHGATSVLLTADGPASYHQRTSVICKVPGLDGDKTRRKSSHGGVMGTITRTNTMWDVSGS